MRGYQRGRGRFNHPRASFTNMRRSHDMMSSNDRDFLFGPTRNKKSTPITHDADGYTTPRKTGKSPKGHGNSQDKPADNGCKILNLTEHQRQGLIDLGLAPDSVFVKSITTATTK